MRALLAKEWRENRVLLFAFVVLAPALSFGVKQLIPEWRLRPDFSLTFLVPGFLALYVMAIGADLVAGDAGSGRLAFLAALPVRPAKVWAAKVAFLFLGAALFLGYAIAVESVLFSFAGGDLWRGWTDVQARETGLLLAGGVTLAAAVVLWSTLIDHGLAAVLGALLTLGGLGLLAWAFALSRFSFPSASPGTILGVLLVPTAAMLAASLLAFAKGRIHLGCRLRRVGLAVATLLLLLVAPGAAAAARLARWAEIRPGDRDVAMYVQANMVSPDGAWAVVPVSRSGAGPFGASAGRTPVWALFAVRLEDGRILDLSPFGYPPHIDPFPAPGRLVLHRDDLETVFDLEAGHPVSTRVRQAGTARVWIRRGRFDFAWASEGIRLLRDGRDPMVLPKGWTIWSGHGPIGVVGRGPGNQCAAFLPDSGARIDFPVRPWHFIQLPSTEGGGALGLTFQNSVWEAWRLPLDGGPEVRLAEFPRALWMPASPDGRRSVLLDPERSEVVVLDADRGITRFPAPPAGDGFGLAWSSDSDRFLLRTGIRWFAGDLSGQEPALSPVDLGVVEGSPTWTDGRRALVETGGSLLLCEPGHAPRQLLPAE